jgi:hypothetical protein
MRYSIAVAQRTCNQIAAEHEYMGRALDAGQFGKDATSLVFAESDDMDGVRSEKN